MTSEPAAVAYRRVSTYEQKRRGHGIAIHIRDVTLFAERQRLFVHQFYKDEGESGIKEKRTALRRLLPERSPSRNLFHEFEHLGVRVRKPRKRAG